VVTVTAGGQDAGGAIQHTYSTAWLSSHPQEQVVISAIVCKTMGQEAVLLCFKALTNSQSQRKTPDFGKTEVTSISGASRSML
jgi:hypothetical protein